MTKLLLSPVFHIKAIIIALVIFLLSGFIYMNYAKTELIRTSSCPICADVVTLELKTQGNRFGWPIPFIVDESYSHERYEGRSTDTFGPVKKISIKIASPSLLMKKLTATYDNTHSAQNMARHFPEYNNRSFSFFELRYIITDIVLLYLAVAVVLFLLSKHMKWTKK